MTIEQKAHDRAKLITDAQAILVSKDITAEKRTQAHAMIADATALGQDIETMKQVGAMAAELRSNQRPPLPNPGTPAGVETAEQRSAKEEKAFRSYLLTAT